MVPEEEEGLIEVLRPLKSTPLRTALDTGIQIHPRPRYAGSVLHDVLKQTSPEKLKACKQRRSVIHMLTYAGLDVNAYDQNNSTLLHVIVSKFNGDTELAEPLIQAGASLSLPNKDGQTVLDLLEKSSSIPKEVTEVFNKYSPGLWQAVARDDLLSVRKLINLWCRVDIQKNGQTLREKALDMGTEHIIRLIKEIEPSMKLAHAVLAEDYNSAEKILNSNKNSVNLGFKNLGDMGATPLFYAILQNDARLVQLLCEHGARPDAMITLQDEEIPILYAALHKDADPEMIKYLVPPRRESALPLPTLHYRGRHVLLHCVKNNAGAAVVRHILRQGYSELIYLRDERNKCARDLAVCAGKADYVATIDEAVYDWYLDVNDENRKAMALMGYPHLREAAKDGVHACEVVKSMETSSPQAQFDTQLHLYQDQIERFVSAVVAGNLDQVRALVTFSSDYPGSFVTCLANCRAKGDGQPPLHKAVLRGHMAVIEFLVQTLTQEVPMKVDEVRDQCQRTALHYAYALPHCKHLVGLLLDYGASEFTMDKDCRSPLVFKDFAGQPDMDKLLAWHRDQLYSEPEPDPWSKRLPPIIVTLKSMKAQGGNHEFLLKQAAAGHILSTSPPSQQPVSTWASYCNIL